MASRREFLAMTTGSALLAADRRAPHHFYRLKGSPYEVGQQHGKLLKLQIRSEAQPAVDRLGGGVDGFLAQYEPYWKERLPQALEEIHGIADGAELSYPFAFFAATRDFSRTDPCTAIACSGTTTSSGLLDANAGQFTAQSLQAMLRDHRDYPLSICRHAAPNDAETTNAAFVADLHTLEMHIAIGIPA